MVGVAIHQAYRKVLQTNRNLIVCLTRGGAAINDVALGRRSEAIIGVGKIVALNINPATLSHLKVAD